MTHRPLGQVRRYREIVAVLVKYGFVDVVRRLHLSSYLAAGRRVLALAGRPVEPDLPRAQRLRLACEELGPTFIKFGQALSTRTDLLPHDVITEFARLQDDVPPLPQGAAERAIEAALGRTVEALFARFDTAPLAAASIAQVHRAVIRREQDLAREGRIIERFASQFAGDETVCFPRVYWDLTVPAVLTMEYLDGVKVSAVGTPEAPDLDPRIVAARGADAVLTQILEHGLFHADPHPGNILIMPGNIVAFIDFGIVGRVSRDLRRQLAEVIQAIWQRDAERIAAIVVDVAQAQRPVELAELARDLEEMLDAYADVPIGKLSMAEIFGSVTAAVSRHRLKLPADLLLLIKAIVTIEGVGRQIDPEFKMVQHAMPVVQRLALAQHRPSVLARRAAGAGRDALGLARTLPRDVAMLLKKAGGDGLQIQFVHRNLDFFVHEMDRSSNRLSFAIIIAAIVVGSAVVIHAGVGPQAFGYSALGIAGFVVAGLLGIGLAIGILRSGKL
jgi:ubiquinone biosynthesis protein